VPCSFPPLNAFSTSSGSQAPFILCYNRPLHPVVPASFSNSNLVPTPDFSLFYSVDPRLRAAV
jgi:hypothetical protein